MADDLGADFDQLLGQDSRIEVVATDITLPGRLTGLDRVRQARKLLPDLKILTISGNAGEASIKAPYLDRLAFPPSRSA
jgi:CheY-like chemotaxis protein